MNSNNFIQRNGPPMATRWPTRMQVLINCAISALGGLLFTLVLFAAYMMSHN